MSSAGRTAASPVTDAAIRASAARLLHLRHARVANIAARSCELQDVGFSAVGLDGSAERSIFDTPCRTGGRDRLDGRARSFTAGARRGAICSSPWRCVAVWHR
jgi:hypothetical protein